jgi:hypothetical protein
VASAYGLDRADYEHLLSSFSHKSFTHANTFCLAAFDELAERGLEAFCNAHDPYFDIPLITALARPVINSKASCRQLTLLPAEACSARPAADSARSKSSIE